MIDPDGEVFDVVDSANKVLYQKTRKEVHTKGLLHRSLNIILFNSGGKIFLQKRGSRKKVYPSTLDVSVSEHVSAGEEYDEAAVRGLKEELGINGKPVLMLGDHLHERDYGAVKENELMRLYKVVTDSIPEIDGEEVDGGEFLDPVVLVKLVRKSPDLFTPWFHIEWEYIKEWDEFSKQVF